jgi:hypothetical protein
MTLHELSLAAPAETILFNSYSSNVDDLRAADIHTLKELKNVLSDDPYFISLPSMQLMSSAIEAIEFVFSLSEFTKLALDDSVDIAKFDGRVRGVFYGYDFHITPEAPKLIEINSNAGGALISSYQALHREKLTRGNYTDFGSPVDSDRERDFINMFLDEWRLFAGKKPLETVAIVDIDPDSQFLKNEFKLFSRLFRKFGIDALILDPRNLVYDGASLRFGTKKIDMIYNRMTDFYFSEEYCRNLKEAYLNLNVAVTPNPRSHAIYANKRNMVYLSDQRLLRSFGVPHEHLATLAKVIPKTIRVTQENAIELWNNRKRYFFKPVTGYGGKAVYRGDKLTKSTWKNITASDSYIAQEYVPPGQKLMRYENQQIYMKADVRNYVYNRKIQLTSARLYQGQTTNFRTPGGGFAIVVPVDDHKAYQLNLAPQNHHDLDLEIYHHSFGIH